MSFFNWLPGQEDKKELASQRRDQNFARERDAFQAGAMDSEFDRVMNEKSDLIRWQQELQDELEALKHKLRSEEWNGTDWNPKKIKIKTYNQKTKTYDVQDYEIPAMCNEMFIDFIDTYMQPFLSRSLINSNLNEKRILLILRNSCDEIADAMSDNYDTYDIKFENFGPILQMIKNFMIPAIYRSINGWTKHTDSTLMKRIEALNSQYDGQQSKKGLLGGVFGG